MFLVIGLEAWGRQVGKSASRQVAWQNSCIRNTIKTLIELKSSLVYDLVIFGKLPPGQPGEDRETNHMNEKPSKP